MQEICHSNDRQICSVSGKICYSRKDAGEICNKRGAHGHKNKPMRYYYCRECGSYHTTHYKKRLRRFTHG